MLVQCFPDKEKHPVNERNGFKKLTRQQQNEKCGSCHKEIYENEKNGPHANAYKMLSSHFDFIESPAYDFDGYRHFLEFNKKDCESCHAAQNLYEDVFKSFDDTSYSHIDFYKPHAMFVSLRSIEERSTGVDCMTCHYNGQRVVTSADFKPSNTGECPTFCRPVASKLFSSNLNCYPCHAEQVGDLEKLGSVSGTSKTCASCHSETNTAGKYTHYTYWAHNPEDKKLPERLNIFNDIRASRNTKTGCIEFFWLNNSLPHITSVCTELVAFVAVKYGGAVVAKDTIRLNRKTQHERELAQFVPSGFPGIYGKEFKGLNDTIKSKISLRPNASLENYSVSILGIKKEQYWLNDSISSIYFNKTVPINSIITN